MAGIKKVDDNTVEVTVFLGRDANNKMIRKFKRFTKPEKMTNNRWEKEIQKIAVEFEREVLKHRTLDAEMLFKDYVKKWIEEYGETNLEQTTLDSYKRELKTKILPALGHQKLGSITPMHILSFLNNLLEDGVRVDGKPGSYSDKTIKYQWQILSSLFQQAVYWQILTDNPCRNIKPPKNKKGKNGYNQDALKFYNEEQALILLQVIDSEVERFKNAVERLEIGSEARKNFTHTNPMKYQAAINIALFCGLRNGEILGLTWDDIDFENKSISINKARALTDDDGMITKYPKTKSSTRTISAPDIVINSLKEYKKVQDKDRELLSDIWDSEWYNTPWILTQWDGKGMYYHTISKWLKKIVSRYNESIINDDAIPSKEKAVYLLPVLSIHKLRHTSATLLISRNTDIKTVAARLGHAQTSTTMDIYVHGLKSVDKKASDTLEELLTVKKPALKIVK